MCPETREWIGTLADVWLAAMTTALALFTWKLFAETKGAAARQLGVNTWLHFTNKWDSPEMRRERRTNAASITMTKDNTDPILDFFEQVGTVYEKKCIDHDLAASSFSHDAEHWYFVLKGHIVTMRDAYADKSTYKYFQDMVEDMHRRHPEYPPVTQAAADKYIQDEAGLS